MVDKQLLKLSKLLEHWANHNDSHKESFVKWRDIAKEKSLTSVVENINNAIENNFKFLNLFILSNLGNSVFNRKY
jgi:hypothetical protein